MEITERQNALLKSVVLFVDVTTIHVTLYFDYTDGSQVAGPFAISSDLLRAVSRATDEREWSKISNKAVRVGRKADGSIASMSHFLRDEWFTF